MKYIQVFTTTKNKKDAENIVQVLLGAKLAGCVSVIGPVTSYYWWKGNSEKTQEYICIIKSKENLYKKIESKIKDIHPYENPEIIAVPILHGSNAYLGWLNEQLEK